MLSKRLPSDLSPTPLAARLAELGRHPDAIDLIESNPTRVGLRYPDLAGVLDARPHYDPQPLGLVTAREAVSRVARVPVDPARVVLTTGTSEAYSLLFRVFCDPGGRIAVPRPSYPLFEQLAALDGVEVAPYRLEYRGGRWALQLDEVAAALAAGARLVIGVNPNNPTGSAWDANETRALRALCAEHDAALVSDEVFARYGWGQPELTGAARPGDDGPITVVLDGLSKSCLLPHLKLGWMQLYGPERAVAALRERLAHAADAYLSVATPVQLAAAELLARTAPLRAELLTRIVDNRAALAAAVADLGAVQLLAAEGGWYAVLRLPRLRDDDERVLALAREHHLIVHPGWFYDFETPGHLVLGLIQPRATFTAALQRLRDALTAELA